MAAVPELLGCLHHEDERACTNCQAALARMIEMWEPDDERLAQLAGFLADIGPGTKACGQATSVQLATVLLQRSSPDVLSSVILAVTKMLEQAPPLTDERVQRSALRLARELLKGSHLSQNVPTCRRIVRVSLTSPAADNRIAALCLAMTPGMNLSEPIVVLLDDPVAEVRRTAMLIVGPDVAAINTDDLLRWLHDPDEDIRWLCEKALRARGLREEHLKLGRLMTDDRPATRLQVLDLLPEVGDLEPGVWLRRLSHDFVPAVRAAAVRAAAQYPAVDLNDRLEQMVHNDPCPTVRQLAAFYRNAPRPGSVNAFVR
jgi:HEAT repeat protein